MRKIAEIREIISGQQANRLGNGAPDPALQIKIISPSAIRAGYFDESLLTVDYAKSPQDLENLYKNNKVAKKGDIIMKMSSPYEACLFTPRGHGDTTPYVVPSYCCIIRVFISTSVLDVDNYYLCAVLNSDHVKAQIKKFMTGYKNPMLKISDLREITIPIKSGQLMKKIGLLFWYSFENEKTFSKLLASERELINTLIINPFEDK